MDYEDGPTALSKYKLVALLVSSDTPGTLLYLPLSYAGGRERTAETECRS